MVKYIYKVKNYKQYWGHKLLWYLQKTCDGKKFPNFIENIDGALYYNAITEITYWLLTGSVFNDLILKATIYKIKNEKLWEEIINYFINLYRDRQKKKMN